MEVMVENCCGIDVHQKSIQCCIFSGPLDSNEPRKLSRSFKTSTKDLRNALSWLIENEVTDVFFESTGQYWIPVHNIFSDSDINLVLANPQHIKNVPGRKTDIRDAEWIAQLGRCGLIATSYIPTEEVMQLRLLTRGRKLIKKNLHNVNRLNAIPCCFLNCSTGLAVVFFTCDISCITRFFTICAIY